MITVAALTAGVNIPSSRFRIRQYIPRLAEEGIKIYEHIPYFEKSCGLPSPFKAAARIPALIRSRKADVVWIGKELVQGYETFERLLKQPRIMDVDDAIWLSRPFGRFAAADIARAMDAIVVGNNYLADYFSRYCRNIYIVPTAVDPERYVARIEPASEPEKFVIGWTGLACNYKYLNIIEPILQKLLREYDRIEIVLISNKPWKKIKKFPPNRVKFIRWSEENEVSALHRLSVGIMPLTNDKWTRGKCSFKMLQYMATSVPVVVSPVGMNREILAKGEIGFAAETEQEWYEALEELYRNWTAQKRMGGAGRKLVEQFYSTETTARELAQIFKNTAGRSC